MFPRRPLSLIVMALALVLPACGSDNKVGDESLLDFKEQVNDQRLGATTTTVAPSTTAPADANQKAGIQTNTTTTTAPATTSQPPTTQAPVQYAEISINSDSASTSQFDPSHLQVFQGTRVRWTNKDSVPHSVESDDAKSFASGPIPPGGTYVLKTTAIGEFNYHDGSRPYAVASLEVLARG